MFTKETIVDQDTGDYEGKKSWPAWYYGPDGAHQIFQNEDEVPEGWFDSPAKLEKPKAQPKAASTVSPYKDKSDAEVVEELKLRKIDFNDKWPRAKLEGLLLTDDKKGK